VADMWGVKDDFSSRGPDRVNLAAVRVPCGMTCMRPERLSLHNGCRVMQNKRAQYREFAKECEQLAKLEQSERHRMILREMAEAWRQLAAQADNGG
jgi:hypothetical protein